ncbi:hypothetical protein JCM10213_006254, partial [Rhodosporidiobolus nylandii]
TMELFCFISSLNPQFDFALADPNLKELGVLEGFLRRPTGCLMGLKRREPEYVAWDAAVYNSKRRSRL